MGAGAWGTALALNAHRAGRDVTIWAREANVAQALSDGRGNPDFLPNVDMPAMKASSDMADLAACDAIMIVTPAQFMRASLEELSSHLDRETPIALCSKGIETKSLKLMTDVVGETLPQVRASVLSGPSFAIDVARGLPTAVTLASKSVEEGERWMEAIGRPEFRPYYSPDLIGAEVGGAAKNVLAIACCVVEGLALGKSAHAALIARGFAEMRRLGAALGAEPETMSGLCGLGDLVLTCSSPQSRNMSFGHALGQGRSAEDILAERKAVTEGVATAPAIVALAKKHDISMPICEAVDAILAGRLTLDKALDALLNRPFRSEF